MNDIGYAALVAALIISLYSAFAWVVGARKGYPELAESARNGILAVCGLVVIASAALVYALVNHDFQVKYVWEYTSSDMSLAYIVAAFWAGQEGSLLLWALVLSVFGVVVVWQNREQNRALIPYVAAVVMVTEAFFLFLLGFVASPFARFPSVPAEGRGLNPLLENMGMFFHPTTLYLGYVGFTIPFAFAMAALITGRLGDEWIRSTRRWALFAWFFLVLGNLFGAQWAYVELGWGGYWAWDPVENASFMPFLTGTAYLHSVMIQQRRGMLKVWNMVLIIVTFGLSIFGTFLTRSGVLSSVHTFGESSLGSFFLAFIGLILIGSLGLLFDRLPLLRGENELDSFVSRESTFLLNNLILVGAAFATFWGTIFPIVAEAVRGVKVTVGPPFFNQVNGPIFAILIVLMGICPLIGWRRASVENLLRNFLYPLIATVVFAGALFGLGMREPYAVLAFSLCAFVTATILLEWLRGVRARHRSDKESYPRAFVSLVWHNKPRYGGYIVHLGIILIAVGVMGSTVYKTEKQATLAKGETMTINQYALTYTDLAEYSTASRQVVAATLAVTNSGQPLGRLVSEKYFHRSHENPVTEVGIWTTLTEDLYVILAGWGEDGTATFKVLVNPLVIWIWIGGGVLLLGTAIAFWPDKRERRRVVARGSEAN